MLYKDLVILVCDKDNGETSFMVALDKNTGEEAWRTARTVRASWSTPLLVDAHGRAELITSGHQLVTSYDPRTGKELWRTEGLEANVATTVAGHGMAFVSAGWPHKITYAVKDPTLSIQTGV